MNLFEKLLEVKKQVPYLKKGTKAYQFNYASPETVLGHINPLLNEQGILLKTEVLKTNSERVTTKTKSGEKDETLYKVDMKFTWVNCSDPNDRDENLWFGSGVNGDEQGFGSALTYAERYFMLKYFNIPTGKDDPDSFVERQKLRSESTETHTQGNNNKSVGETLNNQIDMHKSKISKLESVDMLTKYYKGLRPDEQEICVSLLAERKAELSK